MRPPQRWLIPFGTWLLRFLPSGIAASAASVVAALGYLCLRERRRTIEANLSHIVPGISARERRRLARATFRNFSLMWVDMLRLPLHEAGELRALLEWDTRENLDRALAVGRGAILVTLHLGGVDLSGALVAAFGYPLSAVAEDIDPDLFEVLRRYRSCTGMRVLPRREPLAAYRVLRRGQALALVADRLLDGPGIVVAFCGGVRMMPTGPAAFALRAGAPIVITYMTALGRERGVGRYRLVTKPMLVPTGTADDLTRVIAGEFSSIVRAHPDQWFVFQPNWMDDPAATEAPTASAAG